MLESKYNKTRFTTMKKKKKKSFRCLLALLMSNLLILFFLINDNRPPHNRLFYWFINFIPFISMQVFPVVIRVCAEAVCLEWTRRSANYFLHFYLILLRRRRVRIAIMQHSILVKGTLLKIHRRGTRSATSLSFR